MPQCQRSKPAGLTKHYGHRHPSARVTRSRRASRRGVWLPRPERSWEEHDDSPAARVSASDLRQWTRARPRHRSRQRPAIRRRIGYLPGGIALYDTLTGERLLDYLGELTGRPPVRRRELCDRLELSRPTLKRLVRDYSRGMRQKIGIVQALQHDPELAILDEPSEGPRPADAAGVLRDPRRAQGRRADDFFLVARPLRGGARLRSRRDRPAGKAGRAGGDRRAPGQAEAERADAFLRACRRGWRRCLASRRSSAATDGRAGRPALLRCRVEGDVGPFLAAIAGAGVEDLTIEPARLEEAFLEFYDEVAP